MQYRNACCNIQGHCHSVNKKPSGYLNSIASGSPIYFDQCFSLAAKMGLISLDHGEPYCEAKCITARYRSCGKNITHWNECNPPLVHICTHMDEKAWDVVLPRSCDLVRSIEVQSTIVASGLHHGMRKPITVLWAWSKIWFLMSKK